MSSDRQILFAIGAVLLSTLGILAVGELVCRVAFPDQQLRYATDNSSLYRVAPNQRGYQRLASGAPTPLMHINALGFRGPELRVTDDGHLLVLGDSFTFGAGVADSETFPALMDGAFQPTIQVVNGGQPGYGIYQMAGALKRAGDVVRPRRVLLVIWQGDFVRQPLPPPEHEQFLRRDRMMKRIKVSVLATHLFRMVERLLLAKGLQERVLHVGEAKVPSDTAALINAHVNGLRMDLPRLREMNSRARAWGSGLILAFWPREGFAADSAPGLSTALSAELAAFARREAMPYVSIQPAFMTSASADLLIPGDGHPTPFAHCLVARYLLEVLRSFGEMSHSLPECRSPSGARE